MNRFRGHTLLEVVIASALMGICLLGILALVRSGARYLQLTEAKTALQSDAIKLMRRLMDEFSETNDSAFEVGNSTNGSTRQGVVFASPRNPVSGEVSYDGAGRMLWPKMVCYYLTQEQGVGCVARNVAAVPHPTAFPPSLPSLDNYLSIEYPSRILARNVSLLELKREASVLALQLRMELPASYGRKYGFEVKTQIFTRN